MRFDETYSKSLLVAEFVRILRSPRVSLVVDLARDPRASEHGGFLAKSTTPGLTSVNAENTEDTEGSIMLRVLIHGRSTLPEWTSRLVATQCAVG